MYLCNVINLLIYKSRNTCQNKIFNFFLKFITNETNEKLHSSLIN